MYDIKYCSICFWHLLENKSTADCDGYNYSPVYDGLLTALEPGVLNTEDWLADTFADLYLSEKWGK